MRTSRPATRREMVPDPFYFFQPSVYVLACLSYGDKYSHPRQGQRECHTSFWAPSFSLAAVARS